MLGSSWKKLCQLPMAGSSASYGRCSVSLYRLLEGTVVSTHADAWQMQKPFCDSRMWRVDSGDLWGLPKDSALMQKVESII